MMYHDSCIIIVMNLYLLSIQKAPFTIVTMLTHYKCQEKNYSRTQRLQRVDCMEIRSTVTLTVDHMEMCDDATHVGNWKANPERSYFTTLAKARQIED